MIQQIRVMLTTSLRQGQTREGMSVGEACRRHRKLAANLRADVRASVAKQYRNIIEGRDSCGELAQHNEASGSGSTVNDAVGHQTVHVLIWGDLPTKAASNAMGV
jgi:hypothetical protein